MKKLIVLLGVIGVSLSAIFVRISTAPSIILVLYRVCIASLLLSPYVFIKSRKELFELSLRDVLLCMVSGVFLGLHFTAYFTSLSFTSIASAVVLVDTEVFFVAFGSILLLKERISKGAWGGILLTFAGSVIIAMADAGIGSDVIKGDILAFSGAFFMAVYTMIGAVCRKKISTTVYTFLVYTSSAVTMLMISIMKGIPLMGYDSINWINALGMAVFCTLMGHSIFSWGLKYLPSSFISTIKLLEPVFASILGLICFGEVPGIYVALGGIIVIAGIWQYSRRARQRDVAESVTCSEV